MLEYTVVEPVILGGKLKGYLLRCDNSAEIIYEVDKLKRALKNKSIHVDGLKLVLGKLVLCK